MRLDHYFTREHPTCAGTEQLTDTSSSAAVGARGGCRSPATHCPLFAVHGCASERTADRRVCLPGERWYTCTTCAVAFFTFNRLQCKSLAICATFLLAGHFSRGPSAPMRCLHLRQFNPCRQREPNKANIVICACRDCGNAEPLRSSAAAHQQAPGLCDFHMQKPSTAESESSAASMTRDRASGMIPVRMICSA